MASQHWPTYVLLSLYVLAMVIVTIIANIQNRRSACSSNKSINSDKSSFDSANASHISTHFLAAKNFGVFVLLLTTFASVASGYTIVGIPNEAGNNGFTAIRWVAGIISIASSMLIIFPRIRRLSIKRNYESPGDFILDRYSSKPLCILITLCLCVPQLLYLAVQIYSLGAVLSNLTDGQLNFYVIIIVATLLILIFEALGGMRSVAYTDAVQATVMILIFMAIPIIIGVQYGGFVGQVVNSDHLPCDNSNAEMTSGCLNYAQGSTADITHIAEEYYIRMPSSLTIVNYILFILSALPYALNPQMLQRAFTSKHDWQVRFVTACMFLFGFLAQIPGIIMGVTHISNKLSFDEEYQSMPAFQAMLGVFRDQGGFVGFLSYIALLAAIAGIMSSADSSLLGVSNTMSCDIFKNWLTPKATATKTVWIGKAISICTTAISIGVACYIQETGIEYGALLILQNGILWQAFPAYSFGLYTNVGTKSVLFGVIFGLLCDIIFVGLVFSGSDPFAAIDPVLASLDKSWSSFIGVAVNLICVAIGHFVFQWRDNYEDEQDIESDVYEEDEENDNQHLSIGKIRDIMKGIKEPMTTCYGLPVWTPGILVLISAFFWIGEIDSDLIGEYGKDTARTFLYNGYITNMFAGLPSWTFASFMWYIAAALCGVYATSLWSVDTKYEDKESVPDQIGANPMKLDKNDVDQSIVAISEQLEN